MRMRKAGLLLTVLLSTVQVAYAQDTYASLARHALAATAKDEKTLDSLAKYLDQGRTRTFYDKRVKFWTRNWAGDYATALEIYVWIASRIQYVDDNRPQYAASDAEAQFVQSIRYGVCHDYAVLYHILAKKAGLDAEYITGMARTDWSGVLGYHAWNAVCIGGEWRMIDSCWGRNPDNGKVDYKWFLLNPERFTETHLPLETNQPCCAYLSRMDPKKLRAIRHKMGIDSAENLPTYKPWSWFDD